jgi:hypothetical protein
MKMRSRKVWLAPLLLACGAALLLLSLAAIAFLVWLRPAAQDWQQSARLGPFTLHVSVQKALRLASHHVILARWLSDSSIHGAAGTWRISADDNGLALTCKPCVLSHRSLGPGGIRLDSALVDLKPNGAGYAGQVRLRSGPHEIAFPWTGVVDAGSATMDITAAGLPIADVVAVLGHDLPETKVATIGGQLFVQMRLHWPERRLETQWTTEGFSVTGLGTENVLNATLPERCGNPARPVSGWLPYAVMAAEDQTFRSHPGFDARQISAALRSNGEDNSLRGASTLTQQLAKLLYTGDERTPQRKLRELLYAVEMEQTLGKARILQLYLALAPWGRNLCGAENAAQQYLGKSANALTPAEAAWLAGLLRNPDAQLRQLPASGIDLKRTQHIVEQMRPMSARRRARALAEIASLKPRA